MLSTTLIISLIIIIFIVLCMTYKSNNQINYIDIDNKIHLLELINTTKQNFTEKINNTREKFNSLTNALTKDEATKYLDELNKLNYWIQNNSGNNGIMKQVKELIQNSNDTRLKNRKILVDILTNMYVMEYMDFLNNQNAEAYKIYALYNNPQNNKYYTQFLD